MENDVFYQYLKLFLEYVSIWALLLIILIVIIYRKPTILSDIPKYVSRARVGEFEIELRQMKNKLAEASAQNVELKAENETLRSLYKPFDAHASVKDLGPIRQGLKDSADSIKDISVVFPGLAPGADAEDVYAAAVILRKRRDISAYDELISAVERIASDPTLEGLRYNTVWTLVGAVHSTVIAAVKGFATPQLSAEQLRRGRDAVMMMASNAHVQKDRADAPDKGIRGPCRHALNWLEKGLDAHARAST